MTKPVLLADLLGGIVMFIWSSVAHMVLSLGEAGLEDAFGGAARGLARPHVGASDSFTASQSAGLRARLGASGAGVLMTCLQSSFSDAAIVREPPHQSRVTTLRRGDASTTRPPGSAVGC